MGDAVGSGEGDGAGGVDVEGQGPAAFVDEVVVSFTHRDESAEVGTTEMFPEVGVVDAAVVEGDSAAGVGAGGIHGAQGPALGPIGQP